MDIKQAMEISAKAKESGYAVAVKNGLVQFQTVEYDNNGVSTVTPRTDWLDYDGAMEIING
jgi:hypothetical protein